MPRRRIIVASAMDHIGRRVPQRFTQSPIQQDHVPPQFLSRGKEHLIGKTNLVLISPLLPQSWIGLCQKDHMQIDPIVLCKSMEDRNAVRRDDLSQQDQLHLAHSL